MLNILSLRGVPIFATFFLWSFGTGALHLARPLFAMSFGVPVFLVTLVIASNSLAHLVSGPITGFATDRWGRKPLLILGLVIRGASTFSQFFVAGYLEYLVLEFIGGLGVSMFITGSQILVADLSTVENRGRVVALRQVSSRLGLIAGPAVDGAIAALFDLRSVFLFNSLTKVLDLVIVLFLIRESRPERAVDRHEGHGLASEGLTPSMFFNRSFLVISLVAFAFAMMSQGLFLAVFPVYLDGTGVFAEEDIGRFLTLAGLATLVVSLPNGFLVDKLGRKSTLVPGLALLGAAAYLLPANVDYLHVLLVVLAFGAAEGMCFGASQAYAMDLAPERRRGSFLGIWGMVNSLGGVVAPLLIGIGTDRFGFGGTFLMAGIAVAVVALIMGLFGPDTGARRRAPAAAGTA